MDLHVVHWFFWQNIATKASKYVARPRRPHQLPAMLGMSYVCVFEVGPIVFFIATTLDKLELCPAMPSKV
jgi:hypothetical protein